MIVPWGQDYGLGMGYQTETNKAVVSPITFTGDKGTPTAKVVTNTFLVSNSEQYTELLQASSDIGLIYGMGSVGLSASLSKCMEIKQNTLHVVVLTKHTSEPKELSDARLEDLPKRKLQRDGPESFHRVFGDRYIAGKSCHGRFAGIYTMTFNSKSQYNNAKAKLQASVQGIGLNAYFSSNMQEFQGQYTSHSWATAEGWPNPDVPVTATPQDLWTAATGMDTSKGTPSGALLRPYSHLLDYLNAKDAYAHSFKAWFRNLFGAQQLPSNYEENDSVITARRRVGLESSKMDYMEKLLEAAKSSASDAQDLNAMYHKVVAARLQLLYTFRDPANLWALAVRLQHHERPTRPTSTHCCSGAAATLLLQQWDQGQELQQQLLQAEQLRAAAQQEVDRLLRENDSRWFGDQSGGKLRRVELNGRELLTLVCVAPSSPALGSYAVSHLEGAAEKAFWPLDNAYLRGLARVNTVLLAPIAPVLRLSSKWSVGEAIWNSDIEAVPVPALRLSGLDVVRVDVLEGTIDGGPMVLQIKLHCSDNSVIQVPNCDESELFEVSRKPWVSIPQPGVSGKVVAVSGQGHALKFHWVSKP